MRQVPGVDISSDLSWKSHVSRITNTANTSLGFKRRNLKATNTGLRENAYRPQLEYAAPVWDHIQKSRVYRDGRLGGSLGITPLTQVSRT